MKLFSLTSKLPTYSQDDRDKPGEPFVPGVDKCWLACESGPEEGIVCRRNDEWLPMQSQNSDLITGKLYSTEAAAEQAIEEAAND